MTSQPTWSLTDLSPRGCRYVITGETTALLCLQPVSPLVTTSSGHRAGALKGELMPLKHSASLRLTCVTYVLLACSPFLFPTINSEGERDYTSGFPSSVNAFISLYFLSNRGNYQHDSGCGGGGLPGSPGLSSADQEVLVFVSSVPPREANARRFDSVDRKQPTSWH